ncbi:MAG TPA: YbaN family protein [Burkholderiales bacterium]|nr:YbaN family protein [Burkholderiales bacterium]
MEKIDFSHEVRKHDSPVMRGLYLGLGTAFVVLGGIGLILPLLPTTPFLLLAAACYARASSRFYNALLNHRSFGPLIVEWRRHRSIPWRVKITAIVLMSATLASSIVFFVDYGPLKIALAFLGVMLAIWLYRIPSRDRTARR